MKPSLFLLSLLLTLPSRAEDEIEIVIEDESPPAGESPSGNNTPSATDETLEEMVIVASRYPETWLDTRGTVTSINRNTMEETGVQDLGSLVKYDPNVVVPFDMTTGDGAVGYAATGAASFNIRGIEGNRVGIEVDGIRQPPEYLSTSFDAGAESGSGGIGRDYFDPSMFQLVEILKGGASALYGSDALGGVVSMKTLDPSDLYADKTWGGLARTQFFSRNDGLAWQLGGGARHDRLDYMLLYAGRESNETSNNGRISPDPMTMESHSWLAKVGWDAGDHIFQFTFENYRREIYADMQSALHGPIDMFAPFRKSVENWQDVERNRASIKWIYQPAGGWIDKMETSLYWQKAETSNRNLSLNPRLLATQSPYVGDFWKAWIAATNPSLMVDGRNREQWIEFDTEIYGINSVASKSVTLGPTKHLFLAGLDLSRETSVNRFDRNETNGTLIPDLSGPPGTFNEETITTAYDRISFAPAETTRLGFFLQDDVQLTEKWNLTAGIRFDYHEIDSDFTPAYRQRLENVVGTTLASTATGDYDNVAISPRLDLSYKTTENSRLYAGYGMGIRNPTAEELTMIFDHPAGANTQTSIPNPDLEEEISHAFKFGYKAQGDPGRAAIELFYTRYTDFIESNVAYKQNPDGSFLTQTQNRGTAEIYGIEASGEWDAGSWKPQLDGFTIGLNGGYTIGDNLTIGEPINTVEPWKIIGFVGYADPDDRFGARLIGTYTGAVTRTDDTTFYGTMYHPDAWFTLDLAVWWKPVTGLTLNAGINNIFDEQYWNWSTVRRGGGHLGLADFGGQASSVDDRTTAPGRNFYVSATWKF